MVNRLIQVCVAAVALVYLCQLAGGYRSTTLSGVGRESRRANYALQTPGETILLSDDFNQNAIDPGKWMANNLFSGFTDASVTVAAAAQQLSIGPLKQGTGGSHYNGLRSAATFSFSGAYCYVQVVTPPASNTAGDAMLTVGPDVNNYYRMYIESGNLVVQRKAGGSKAVLFSGAYNGSSEKYIRIRHDGTSGNVIFEVATDGGGVPGSWSAIYSEPWSSSISMSGVIFEIKAGTWQAEANPPGTAVFDNFKAARP